MALKEEIKHLMEIYQDEIDKLEEDRRNEGIGTGNILRTGKIGAYGKVVHDLTDMLEVAE